VTWREAGSSNARPGDRVGLGIDAAHSHLFDEAGEAFPGLEWSTVRR
jgi:hypothetical protein